MCKRTRIAVSTQLLVSAVCAAAVFAENQTVIYQNGTGGYAGQVDNHVGAASPNGFRNDGGTDLLHVGGGTDHQVLLRFDGIPLVGGASIVSATLTLVTGSGDAAGTGRPFYRMLRSWTGTDTYNTLGSGIQRNGVEASSTASFEASGYIPSGPISFDATADVRAWAGGQTNYGWVIAGSSTDGWLVFSGLPFNYAARPKLTVVYSVSHGLATWGDLSGDHIWNTTSPNWRIGGAAMTYPEGDWVTFNDNGGAGHYDVSIPANVNPTRVFVNNSTGNYMFTGAGAIGAGYGASLTKLGHGSATLNNASRNTFAGGLSVYQGMLAVDLSAIPGHTNLIDSGANLVMSGGTLVVKGYAAGTSAQSFAGVNFESGASTVAVDTNGGAGTTLHLGCLTHAVGSTVDFVPPTGGSRIKFTNVPTSGYLLGYSTIGGTDWANWGADGSVIANPVNVANTWSTSNHTDVTASNSVAANASTKTLRYNAAVDTTLTLAASGTATLVSGGILVTANVGTHNNRITGGALSSVNWKDLVVIQNNSQGSLTVEAQIINGAEAATGLTISGSGVVAVTAANSFSGMTTINNAILSANLLLNGGANSSIGNSSNAAANLVLNQGTLRYTGGQTVTNRLLTLGPGGGCLDASGTGTIVFSNTGAMAYSQNTPAVFTLTGTNTNSNIFVPCILDPDTSHQYTTTLVKSGPGTWMLNNSNSYSGGTSILGGTLQIGLGSNTGSLGTGPITNNGKLIYNRNDMVTIANPITGPGTLTQTGTGAITFSNYSGTGAINISNSGRLAFAPTTTPNSKTVITPSLTIIGSTGNWTSTLDIGNNALVVKAPTTGNAAQAQVRTIANQIASGIDRTNPGGILFNGKGITSSTAGNYLNTTGNPLYAIGWLQNNTLGLTIGDGTSNTTAADGAEPLYPDYGQFASDNPSIGLNDVLVKYTYWGDADLNGIIDDTDVALLVNGYQLGLSGWVNGDFNYDGIVDDTDVALLINAYQFQQGPLTGNFIVLHSDGSDNPTTPIPEPASLLLLSLGSLLLLRQPRRKNSMIQ